MAVTLSASSPPAVYGDTQSTTSLVTASFTPPSGSIVVAKIVCADAGQTISTVTGLTFTSRVSVGTSGASARTAIYTATGGGSAVTVTAAFAGGTFPRALIVEVWTGAQLAGTPATGSVVAGSGAPTNTITTTAANSVVTWADGDWAAIDGTAGRTYRSSAVETAFHWVSGQHTVYAAYQQAATAGSQTYGLTAPTGQTYTLASIELQAFAAGPTQDQRQREQRPPWRVWGRDRSMFKSTWQLFATGDLVVSGTTPVSTSASTTWDTFDDVTPTRSTTWVTAAVVSSTRATTWTALSTVTDTNGATTWAVRAAVAQTRASSWATFAAVAPTRATTWTTGAAVVKAPSATTWVTRAAVASTRASTWNVIGPIAASRGTTWVTAAAVASTRATTWAALTVTVKASSATTWAVRAAIPVTRATTWTTRATVVSTTATTWLTATSTVTNRATTWVALAAVIRTRATTWDVAGPGAYRVFDPTAPPSIGRPADTSAVDVGTEFYVTDTATVTDLHYLHVNDAAASLATRTLALYDMTAASFVAQVNVTPTSADQGKWVAGHLSTPYSLVINRHYKAVTLHPAGDYAATAHYFDSGAGASGLASGPIVVPNAASATSPGQGTFHYASALADTDSQFNSANYWNDVTVSVPVAGAVIVTRPTTWNVTATVTASRGSTWQTSVTTTTTRATTWATLAAVPSTRPSTWVTYAAVAKASATTWNVVGPIQANRATTWVTRAAVTATVGTTWQTSATLTKPVAATWAVLVAVPRTRPTTWAVSASVAPTRATTWAARANVAPATRATSWTVTVPVAPVTRATTWAVALGASANRSTTWITRASVAPNRATTWQTRAITGRALGTTWAVWIGPIQTSRNTTWRTFLLVGVSRNTLWITAGQVTHTAQTRWAILKPAIIRPTVDGTYRPHTTDTHRVRGVTYRP